MTNKKYLKIIQFKIKQNQKKLLKMLRYGCITEETVK